MGKSSKYLLVVILVFGFYLLSLGTANKAYATCQGSMRCVNKDPYGVCGPILYSSLGCGGATTESECLDREGDYLTACEGAGNCGLGGCNWIPDAPTPTPGGGGGDTPTPPPAGCSATAVLSPGSAGMNTGLSTTFTLTVTDSPAGCVDTASFVKSGNNVSITSTNPDPGRPFTAVVRCDVAGTTATVTGRAFDGGVLKASDSSSITCNSTVVTPTNTPPPTPVVTNTPTPIPCVINSAVLTPSSTAVDVGGAANFVLTVNDSPSGCSQSGSFVRSNTNISITSANPDTSEPFVATVYCNNQGTASVTGRAMFAGVVGASDSSSITCRALPTPPPTATAAPGQCNNPSLNGSGACSGSNLNLNYSWGGVSGASDYQFQLSQNSSFSSTVVSTVTGSTSYSTSRPGGTYYARARVNSSSGSCAAPSNWSNVVTVSNPCGYFVTPTPTPVNTPTPTPPPGSITVPPLIEINGVGGRKTIIVTVSPSEAFDNNPTMTFGVAVPAVATIDPTSKEPAYQVEATGLLVGRETNYTAVVTDKYGNLLTGTGLIRVINPDPWCQGKDGDVVAGDGSLYCEIPSSCELNPPCEPYLITYSSPNSPGVAAAGGSVGTGQTYYKVTGESYAPTQYDYDYFSDRIGANAGVISGSVITESDLEGLPDYAGYKWGRYAGGSPASIDSDIDLDTKRVVLLVENSDLNINGKIRLTRGRGFFMAIVKGDVNVGANVGGAMDADPDIEGMYFAEGSFNTLSLGPDGDGNPQDSHFHLRGTVVAGDFTLERNLPNNSGTPAEFFEFGADLLLQYPSILSRKQIIWREVAP